MATEKKLVDMRASEAIGLAMSHSRVKTRLNRYNVNKAVSDEMEALTAASANLKDKSKAKVANDAKHAAVARIKDRISDSTPIVLTCVIEQMLSQLVAAGFRHATDIAKRRTLQVSHLTADDTLASVALSSLYSGLDSYRHPERYEKQEAVEGEEEEAAADESDDDDHDRSQFSSYVTRIMKNVRESEDDFKNLRVAKQVTQFVNDLVVDFVQRVGVYSEILLSVKDARTISQEVVLSAVKLMVYDSCSPTGKIVYTTEKDSVTATCETDYGTTAFSDLETYINGRLVAWEAWKTAKEGEAAKK